MMQVLHIVDTNGLGGAQQLIKGLANTDEREEWAVFFLRKKTPEVEMEHSRVYYGRKAQKYGLAPFKDLVRLVRKEQPSIMHCHLTRSLFAGLFLKIRFPGLIVIYHEHGAILRKSRKMDYWLHRMLIKLGKYSINKFIAVSVPVKEALLHHGCKENQVVVMPNFIEDQFFYAKQHASVPQKRPFVIGYTGRLNAIKRLDIVLHALVNVAFDFTFVIVGEGQQKQRLRDLAVKLQIENFVIFEGYKSNIAPYLSSFDVYVLASDSEAHPVGLLEAMAAGIPVVVSSLPAFRNYTTSNPAFLQFKRGSAADCRNKLSSMYNHYTEALKSRKTLQYWAREFTKNTYINKLNALYKELLEH